MRIKTTIVFAVLAVVPFIQAPGIVKIGEQFDDFFIGPGKLGQA